MRLEGLGQQSILSEIRTAKIAPDSLSQQAHLAIAALNIRVTVRMRVDNHALE
jgi:hypothetical protein